MELQGGIIYFFHSLISNDVPVTNAAPTVFNDKRIIGFTTWTALHSITCASHNEQNSNGSILSYLLHRLHYRILLLYIVAFFITCGGQSDHGVGCTARLPSNC